MKELLKISIDDSGKIHYECNTKKLSNRQCLEFLGMLSEIKWAMVSSVFNGRSSYHKNPDGMVK